MTPYWPEPAQAPHAGPGYPQEPTATGHWTFGDAQDSHVPQQPHQQQHEQQPHQQHGGDLTGQWTIPVAEGDVPEESGEYAASSLSRPATLPGGAPAPWAVPAEEPEPHHATPADGTPVPRDEHGTDPEPTAGDGHGTTAGERDVPGAGHDSGHDPARHGSEHDAHDGHDPRDAHEDGVPHPAPDRHDVPAPVRPSSTRRPGQARRPRLPQPVPTASTPTP